MSTPADYTRDVEREQLQTWLAQNRRAVLVVNTASRRGQGLYSHAEQGLRRAGFALTAFPVHNPIRLPEIVHEAVAQGSRFVIVGGGDGTISAVAGSLAYRDVVLGLLPMGTANNFARGNNIPLDVEQAVAVLAAGKVATVDLGRVNEGFFTNAVSMGLSSALHRSSSERMKARFGRAGYLLAAVQRFAVHRAFQCRLNHDGESTEWEALDVRIANGPFHGGVRAVDEADPSSGTLAVRVVQGASKWTLGRVWAGLLVGLADAACIQTIAVRQAKVETTPPRFVSVDGEVMTRTPIQISVAPKALHLIVP